MSRRLIIILIFLLAGAVVNVGVAWGCVRLALPPGAGSMTRFRIQEPAWGYSFHTPPTMERLESGKQFSIADGGLILEAGCPVRCVRGQVLQHARVLFLLGNELHMGPTGVAGGTATNSNMFAVLWRGLAINSAFYALILWLLFAVPLTARRVIRKRRGRCPKCGYDLAHAEHEQCPECGARI